MGAFYMREAAGAYREATPAELMEAGRMAALAAMAGGPKIENPIEATNWLRSALSGLPHEVFGVLWLNNRNRVIRYDELFRGTIDGASVHPREVVVAGLQTNAACCILTHNHPSGDPEPSQADEAITRRLRSALGLVEIRVLDHIIVGAGGTVSLAERGII